MSKQQIIPVNRFVANLIEANKDDFDIGIATELRELVEHIKHKRCSCIGSQAARKTVDDFLDELNVAV